jgi:ADP-ribosyl-[dinitrogen reductase] hydrolase
VLDHTSIDHRQLPASDRHLGCLLGLACGDALGTTLEFRARGTFEPISDMIGGGPFDLAPGHWTDDTSMALCLAESLVACRGFDARDQMERYCRWAYEGYLSSNGQCFDIGVTTARALQQFRDTGYPFAGRTSADSAGNGCLMRLAPVVMYFSRNAEKAIDLAGESSRTTHGSAECIACCRLLASVLLRALSGQQKEDLFVEHSRAQPHASERIGSIARGAFRQLDEDNVRGSGYVVDCLEAALWCFHQTETFRDAVLKAANLGEDADTTAAVCGQIAGAYYGLGGIPPSWLDRLVMRKHIEQLAGALYATDSDQ